MDVKKKYQDLAALIAGKGFLQRNDANTTLFTANELQAIEAAFYGTVTPRLESLDILSPVDAGPGMDTYSFTLYDVTVGAVVAADGGAITGSSMSGAPTISLIENFRDKFIIAFQELAQAQAWGRPLDTAGAARVKNNIERLMDADVMVGNAGATVKGLLTQTGTTTYLVPADGTASSALWSAKTPVQILRDMVGCVNAIPVATGEAEYPTHLLVPAGYYRTYLQGLKMQTGSSETVLEAFMRATNDRVKVVPTRYMAAAAVAGSVVLNSLVAFDNSPSKAQRLVSLAPSIADVNQLNLGITYEAKGRGGGTVLRYPASMCVGKPASAGI